LANNGKVMQEKILVFDSSIGYAKYFEKIFKKKYEVASAFDFNDLRKVDLFHYDTIIFIINELEEVKLFSKIHSSYKGIRLFLGVTQNKIAANVYELNLQNIYNINFELNKTDMVDYINSKLKQEIA
jgi:hypothetical protein